MSEEVKFALPDKSYKYISVPKFPIVVLPARFIGALLIFISAIGSFTKNKMKKINFLKYFSIVYVLVIIPLAIYDTYNSILPKMFIDGQGLTALKISLEYFVMVFFGISALVYMKRFYKNSSNILKYFIIGLIASFFSELAFTMYLTVSDVFNLLGHVLKLIAYICFFYGIWSSLNNKEVKNE